MLLRPLGQLSIIKKYSGRRTRTVDTLINSQMLYQLSYAGITHGDFLPSQEAFLQLLSALRSLTSVFGMGTGVSFVPSSPHYLFEILFSQN